MNSELVILIVMALAVIANMAALVFIWLQVRPLRQQLHQINNELHRLEHDISHQRYAMAVARQYKTTASDAAPVEDAQMMDRAFKNADIKDPMADVPPLAQPKSLDDLRPGQVLQFLKQAMKSNDISVTMQPTVKFPNRVPVFYEVFSRIKVGDEGFISAGRFIEVARDNNLMSTVDNLLLLRCLQLVKQAAQKEPAVAYFVNISVATLGNKTYVNDLVTFLSANPRLSSRLVFEISQDESLHVSAIGKQVMDALALLGCRFSMDRVTILGLDVDRLNDLNISFVKLDAALLAKEVQDAEKRNRLKRLKTLLETAGITVIMEKIENERQLLNLHDMRINYAQGYLFGRPKEA